MECVICKNGSTKAGFVTVTLERGNSIILFKEVPAQICDNCGHYYLDENIAAEVMNQAEDAISKGTELEVKRLKIAA